MNETPNSSPLREPWIIGIILFFVVVISVNVWMIYLSQTSWNGLVTEHHYEKGLAFNEEILAQRRQDQLQWQAALDGSRLVAGQRGELVFTLTTAQGTGIDGATVTGLLFRPVTSGHDLEFTMTGQGAGRYVAELVPGLPGVWEARIQAVASGAEYRFLRRIAVARR